MEQECLTEGTVIEFVDGVISPAARSVVEAHVAACWACNELVVEAAAALRDGTRPLAAIGRPPASRLPAGSRVGRYQILDRVGRGGMGEVYAAYHPDLDRRIALKVVHESGAGSADRQARLLREARAIARLSHPNVVAVHDAGTVTIASTSRWSSSKARPSTRWLRRGTRSWREILDVFIAAGRGLAAAHAAGIVHRDFKPQNVMIARDGSVRVMDFGLARLRRESRASAPATVAPRLRPAARRRLTVTQDRSARRHARVHGARAVPRRAADARAISSASAWRCTRRSTACARFGARTSLADDERDRG